MTHAIRFHKTGGPEVLAWEEVQVGKPGPGEDLKGANYDQKLYFHKLGTPQADDALIYERPDHKDWQFHGTVTDDGLPMPSSPWARGRLRHLIS